jgi:hypothetical protein
MNFEGQLLRSREAKGTEFVACCTANLWKYALSDVVLPAGYSFFMLLQVMLMT